MGNIYSDRIESLRTELDKNDADWYLCTTSDPHGSEYINDHYHLSESNYVHIISKYVERVSAKDRINACKRQCYWHRGSKCFEYSFVCLLVFLSTHQMSGDYLGGHGTGIGEDHGKSDKRVAVSSGIDRVISHGIDEGKKGCLIEIIGKTFPG